MEDVEELRKDQDTLKTARLVLRPFTDGDAGRVAELLDNIEFYGNTVNIPFPYTPEDALAFISARPGLYDSGESVAWAVTEKEGGALVGCVSLDLKPGAGTAEMGYWTGIPWWNMGYCTEAAVAVLGYAFREIGLNLVEARHFQSNRASGRVMERAGMKREAVLRQRICKDGEFLDLVVYSVTREEFPRSSDCYSIDDN